jgi:hypothetical protein
MDSKLTTFRPSSGSQGSRPSQASQEQYATVASPAGGYLKVQQADQKGEHKPTQRRLSAQHPQLPSGAFESLPGHEILRDALQLLKPSQSSPAELREGMKKLVMHQVLHGFQPTRVAVALAQATEGAFGVPDRDDKSASGEPAGFGRLLRAVFEAFGELAGVNLSDLLEVTLASSGQPRTVVVSWLLAQAPDGLPRGDLWATAMEAIAGVADKAGKSGDWLHAALAGITTAQQCCWVDAVAALRRARISEALESQMSMAGAAGKGPDAAMTLCQRTVANWEAVQRELCHHAPTFTPAQIHDFLVAAVHAEQRAQQLLEHPLDLVALQSRITALLGVAFEAEEISIARCGAIVAGVRNGVELAWTASARAAYAPKLREGIEEALSVLDMALGADPKAKSDYRRFLMGRLVDGLVRAAPVSWPTPLPRALPGEAASGDPSVRVESTVVTAPSEGPAPAEPADAEASPGLQMLN